MTPEPIVYVVDDDAAVRSSVASLFDAAGFTVQTFGCAITFLLAYRPGRPCCVVLDMCMPRMTGAELQAELVKRGPPPPIVFLTAHGDIPMSVRAIKAGAIDFLTKPADGATLLSLVRTAVVRNLNMYERLSVLTEREHQLLWRMASGASNKEIARAIGISHRTVEVHRGRIMRKLNLRSVLELADLVRNIGLTLPSNSSDAGKYSHH